MQFKIEGMTCEHCVAAVRKALGEVNGVAAVSSVDLQNGTATVEGAPDPQHIVAALAEQGYSAQPC